MPKPETDFPAALAREMARAGLTQAELARRAGIRPSAIAWWLAGEREPGLSSLCAVADALGVKLDRLRA